jgi:class 3 adenylate cyclase
MQSIYKFFSRRIALAYRQEFDARLFRYNLEKTFLMCFVALLFVLLMLPLQYWRFQDGSIFIRIDFQFFLLLHLLLSLLIFPLLVSKKMVKRLHSNQKVKRFPVITITVVIMSVALLGIDFLTLGIRKTTTTYPIFILFINSVIVMSHRNRWAFNLLGLGVIVAMIFYTCKGSEVVTFINILQSLAITVTAFVIGTHQLNSEIRQFTFEKLLTEQQQKSDDLLLNILPESIVVELKENGKVKAQGFENVSIMFCDFVNFSKICQQYPAETLVETLNFYFKKFDEIIDFYPIEKIKTIGDAYLCTAGVPSPTTAHATHILNAAIDIRHFIVTEGERRKKNNQLYFDIRIGIHSGKVVAGIVGTKKFAYDIWGDAVNVAARLQNAAAVNGILLSENTLQYLDNQHAITFKAEMELKNIGAVKLYEVERSK